MEKVEVNSKRWLSVEDLKDEEWAVIKEHPFYAISNYGRLKRLAHLCMPTVQKKHVYPKFLKERICKTYKNLSGYLSFRVLSGDKIAQLSIHRLVATYFVENPHNYNAVNHKNENKSDNYYTNLEFCTDKYNSNYGTCQQRRAASVRAMRRRREILINQYTPQGEFVSKYSNKGEIDDAGFNLKTVLRVCNHEMEMSQGYVWRFDGDPYTQPSYHDSKGGTIKKKVLCYDIDGNFVAQYGSLLSAALALGGKYKRAGICGCCYGKKKQAYGYIWKYANK